MAVKRPAVAFSYGGQETSRRLQLWRSKDGGKDRGRTGDTRIFSPLLYQLSYLATAVISPFRVKTPVTLPNQPVIVNPD